MVTSGFGNELDHETLADSFEEYAKLLRNGGARLQRINQTERVESDEYDKVVVEFVYAHGSEINQEFDWTPKLDYEEAGWEEWEDSEVQEE